MEYFEQYLVNGLVILIFFKGKRTAKRVLEVLNWIGDDNGKGSKAIRPRKKDGISAAKFQQDI